MLVIMAVVFSTLLPPSVSAVTPFTPQTSSILSDQVFTPEPMGPFVALAAGNSSYYRNDQVIFQGSVVRLSSVDLHIGADPEIPGGDQSAPASDEVDTYLTEPIIVITRARSRRFILGTVNPVINGVKVVVRRIKATGKIIEILNCGNWTRALNSDYTFECDTTVGPCVPGAMEIKTTEEVSPDGKTKTVVTVSSDGCTTKVDTRVVTTEIKEVCTENSWLDVFEHGDVNGKLGKSFKADEVIGQLPQEIQDNIHKSLGGKNKINYIFVQRGACESQASLIRVRWFRKDGGLSKWVYFLVGMGVGVGLGYIIRGSPDNPVFQAAKAVTKGKSEPIRKTITGSGVTKGVVGSRPISPTR